MTRLQLLIAILTLAISINATPFALPDTAAQAPPPPAAHKPGGKEHIVIFGPNSRDADSILSKLDLKRSHPDVGHVFNNSAFSGFIANMKSHCIDLLHAMDDVSHVEETKEVASHQQPPSRVHTTWGLQRISSNSNIVGDPKPMDYTYSYANNNLGRGVDIYIVDTGVYTEHSVFGGRAIRGYSFEADPNDNDGHGTHVAGTAAGAVFGVASQASIISIKVLGENGGGTTSSTISGMDHVMQRHDERRSSSGFVGSIMNMSWGAQHVSKTVADVISRIAEAGVHVSVAAGNAGKDACDYTPSASGGRNSDSIVSVGSMGPTGEISSFSNTGPCVDLYAPGEEVLSAWKDTPMTVNYLSGTSMATPHVTGLMAYLMAQNPSLGPSPNALKSKLLSMAPGGVLTGTAINGDPKRMANNGISGGSSIEDEKREAAITAILDQILPRGFRGSFSLSGRKHFGVWGGHRQILKDKEWSLPGDVEQVGKLRL